MKNFYNAIVSPPVYLTFCFLYYSVMAILRLLYGQTLFLSLLGIGIFLTLLLGIVCGIRLARRILAFLHCTYSILSIIPLSFLIYHSGSIEFFDYHLSTVPSVVLFTTFELYFFLGAVRLWKSARKKAPAPIDASEPAVSQ